MEKNNELKNDLPPVSSESVLIGRHFEDIDDLSNGLDTSLNLLTPESKKVLDLDTKEIIKNCDTNGLKRILIISSPKQRARSTSELIKQEIRSLRDDLRVRIKIDNRFAELDHGEIVLPKDYKPRRRIDFLKDAWSTFWSETFTDDGEYKNLSYCFGDPIDLGNGQFKYPEINGKFLSYGENYRDFSLRYYEAILEYLKNKHRMKDAGMNMVLIAHSATLSILTELLEISSDISNGTTKINTGDLMKTCWKRYLDRISKNNLDLHFGMIKPFYIGEINSEIVNLLEKEIKFMRDAQKND